MFPSGVRARPWGSFSCPSPSPLLPNLEMKRPSLEKICIRWLSRSATIMLPFWVTATPVGRRSSPSWLPFRPKLNRNRPRESKIWGKVERRIRCSVVNIVTWVWLPCALLLPVNLLCLQAIGGANFMWPSPWPCWFRVFLSYRARWLVQRIWDRECHVSYHFPVMKNLLYARYAILALL